MRSLPARRGGSAAALALALAMATFSCSSDKSSGPSTPLLNTVVTAVTAEGGATAVFHSGDAPADGDGPVAIVDVQSSAVVGGSAAVNVSSATAFNRILLALSSGARGWYELTLPSATNSANVFLTVDPDVDLSGLAAQFAVGTTGGAIGAYVDAPITIVHVGTGDVQVSLAWDSDADVDLHVVDPDGEEVYYGNDVAASGGTLDLDSNAGCSGDNTRSENITWPTGGAPRGTYTVRVDYWSNCSVAATHYVVTVRREGHPTQTFSGTFTGSGDEGGAGSGTQITTFTW